MFLCILAIHVNSKLGVIMQEAMELMDASGFLPGVQWQETKLNTNFYLMMKPKACTLKAWCLARGILPRSLPPTKM
jgi:hypothetical protein